MMNKTAPAKYPVKSLAKALRLLDVLGLFNNGTSISTLSRELKMGKSTVHRLLATLREFDLVWLDPSTSNYALGARIMRWNDLLVRQNLVVRHGLPIIQELVHKCRETANLGVLVGREILYVAQYESMEKLRMSEAVGARSPAHCTSLGKALLAVMSDAELDELYQDVEHLERVTPNSIAEKHQLKEHLHKVRQDGIAYDFEENAVGVVCMGTVIRNFSGKAVAAMSISTPIQRLRGEKLMTFKDLLLEASNKLSQELGFEANVSPGALSPEPVYRTGERR
jgi:IclR family transcriptional regulator, KDG regulon repressor